MEEEPTSPGSTIQGETEVEDQEQLEEVKDTRMAPQDEIDGRFWQI
jgi:hypothetical protein